MFSLDLSLLGRYNGWNMKSPIKMIQN
jgi:hypothetical protein